MSSSRQRPFYRGLSFKLFLFSLTLLAIPWAGYRYVTETESFLGLAQEQLLLGRAEMVASILPAPAKEYLARSNQPARQLFANAFYAHPFERAIQLDGYPEEWQDLLDQRRHFIASETNPDAIAFDLLVGYRRDTLYLLIQVSDSEPLYARSDRDPTTGDHLLIALPGDQGRTRQYAVGTRAPGWIAAYALDDLTPEPAIQGEWQESAFGYTIELKLPLAMTGGSLSLALVNLTPRDSGGAFERAATSGLRDNSNLSLILIPQPELQELLKQLAKPGIRTRVINRQGLVIGRQGSLEATKIPNSICNLNRLYEAILAVEPVVWDKRENLGRLDGPEIRSALRGTPSSYRHQDEALGPTVLAAAHPITRDGAILGAVIIEQTTDAVLSIQQSALQRLMLISLGLFLLTAVSLLWFAGRLTNRITRIGEKIDRAVSGEGRIHRDFTASPQEDEVGDMERNFASVMQRLQAYNRYLESMASRLAHEFRTPLSMVKSSLENLAQDDSPEARDRYLSRAAQGMDRLSLMLDRMREATRLEQALEMTEREAINLSHLVDQMVDSYRAGFPGTEFACRLPERHLFITGAPELIAQALDKLVSNAVDFHTPGSQVVVTLEAVSANACRISVANTGPKLPETMKNQLFDSMVSIRDRADPTPHLGLGLYLVRLIGEFHHGSVVAENTADGVCFHLQLPLIAQK